MIDGEVVVVDHRGISDYHKLQEVLAQDRSDRLTYYAFDLLYLDGFDLRDAPLVERKALLEHLLDSIQDTGRIRFSEHLEADGHAMVERACAMQLEGIISKRSSSPYRSGRQESWLKIKCNKSDTFPIIAFVEKLGARPRRIASLYLGRWDGDRLIYAGKAQTGFRQADLYDLRERLDPHIRPTSPLSVPIRKPKATWVKPALLAEVEYSALTADRLLRAPVYKGIRDDLSAAEPRLERSKRSTDSRSRVPHVPRENILQWLPDAVVPTKEQLAAYWRSVARQALTYLAGRPLKLVRHTRGTTFYHKGALPPVPASVHQLRVQKREGGEGTRLWVADLAGLLGLVEMGAVELHPWNSRVEDLEHPDVLVFDLDPGPGIEWRFVVDTALELRERLKAEKLGAWPKLTGGKGVHVMAPIAVSGMTHDEAHKFSRALAETIAARDRTRYTTSAAISQRPGRLFIDYLRNGRGTTAVGTYSPRARPGFPIAAPVTWRDIEAGVQPDAFTIEHPFARAPAVRTRVTAKRKRRTTEEYSESPVQGERHKQRQRPPRRARQPTH